MRLHDYDGASGIQRTEQRTGAPTLIKPLRARSVDDAFRAAGDLPPGVSLVVDPRTLVVHAVRDESPVGYAVAPELDFNDALRDSGVWPAVVIGDAP